jgi:hypothetical protein
MIAATTQAKAASGNRGGFFRAGESQDLEHFQKFCGRKKVAAVFNRHAKYMQKGLAVKNRRHDFITVAMTFNKML